MKVNGYEIKAGADLRYANLRRADLRDVNLQGANLRRADLQGANLQDADLQGANLQDADLQGANLQGADLRYANLRGADLQSANLRYANLRGADLQSANLRNVDLDFSVWPLWCGSLDVNIDERIAAQLAYHFCAVKCDSPKFIKARKALLPLANKFHRIPEVSKLEGIE